MKEEKASNKEKFHRHITDIARYRRSAVLRGAVSVLVTVASGAFLLLMPLLGALSSWRYAPLAAWLFFWGALSVVSVYLARWMISSGMDRVSLAEDLGEATGRGTLFTSALEFSEGGARHAAYSAWLMNETIRRAAGELKALRERRLFLSAGRPGWTLAGAVLSAALLAVVLFDPPGMLRLLEAVSDPLAAMRDARGYNLRIKGGDRRVVAGEDVTVEAVGFGSAKGDVRLSFSEVEGVWQEKPVEVRATGEGGPVSYSHVFRSVRDDFRCRFEGGGERTATVSVRVEHRPVINSLGARLVYPSYTHAAPDTVQVVSTGLAALKGTSVHLSGETSSDVARATLIFSSGRSLEARIRPGGFDAEFVLSGHDTMRVALVDSSGLEGEIPTGLVLAAREDSPPVIEVLAPDDEEVLPRSLLARVLYRVSDDFGVSSAGLRYRREDGGGDFSLIELIGGGRSRKAMEDEFAWQLDERTIRPGDRIAWYLEARDGNTATGPGYSRTPVRILVAPSIAEVFAESRREEGEHREDMEGILEKSEQLRDRLDELSEDLKATGEMDWESRRESREILEAQEDLGERIREAAARLDETLERLEQNRMTSMEVGRKLEEIRDLLREIASEEIREAMERLAEMIDEVPESEVAGAMEDIEMSSSEISERLDRTIELLRQVLQEERMEELLRRMEEMLQEQSALRDSTASGELDELASRQRRLEREYEDFEEATREFAGDNEESHAAEEMREMVEEMDSAAIDSMMDASAGQMEEGERDGASRTQNSTLSRMMSLFTEMSTCQNAFAARPDMEARAAIEKAVEDVLEISRLSEEAAAPITGVAAESRLDELLERQNLVREASRTVMRDLLEAGRKSSAVSSLVFARIADALHGVDLTIQALQARQFAAAGTLASRTPRHLNLAAIELLKSSSSSGGGGGGAMQQMRRMLQRQNSIDEQLREMLGSGDRGMSMQQRARMARIAAEQRKLRELMEQIEEESGEEGGLLGRIDDISGEMEEVARMLEEGRLDRDLVEREERILSRMLESQRSLNRRDYSRERVSRPGRDLPAVEGSPLREREEEARILLEQIRKGMREKGPAEYEELIKAYFRALSGKVRDDAGRQDR